MKTDVLKKLCVGLCGALAAVSAAAQQIDVSMTLAYNAYVMGEPVLVQLEALNATRDLLEVGAAGSRDVMLVEVSRAGQLGELKAFNAEPITGSVQLKPGQTMQHKVELDKWFPLVQEGKYLVRFVLVHNGIRYESPKKSFDIVPGLPLKDAVQMFVTKQNLKRLFKLVYWHRNQTDRLFLRIEDDPGSRVWDSIDLGTMMRMTPPKIDISPEGEVTVVHRSTQDAFIRTVLWSLPNSVEVVERNNLLDPEISASQRVKSLYGEMAGEGEKEEKKSWWKFW